MNRIKYMIIMLVVASMMIGAGYAGWNETVNLQTQVETGTFCVQIESITEELIDGFKDIEVKDRKISRHSKDNEMQSVSFKIDNFYPGAKIKYTVKFENLGTVNAALKNITTNLDMSNQVANKIEVSLDGEIFSDYDSFAREMTSSLIKNQVIDAGQKAELEFYIRMKEDVEEGFNHHIKQLGTLEMSFVWMQENLKPEISTDNESNHIES